MSEREQIEFGKKMLEHLPLAKAPDSIWPSIEAALEQNRSPVHSASHPWRWAFAALAATVLLALVYWRIAHRDEWIETDTHSRVTVKVGEIGTVEVEPGTRLRVVSQRSNEHRFALAHGEIRAKISAPPKLFFVDTAVGTAIDLGCEYTLTDDELGRGVLTVSRGWVSFQWKGVESLVPAGASCQTHPRIGPGIPYFDDAAQNLKQAVENFALDKGRQDALNVILAEARVRDTLTLWHLLQRVDVPDRIRVYDRIASLTPVPSSVSRERALQLDPETLKLWKDDLAWKW
jgi:FecR protein